MSEELELNPVMLLVCSDPAQCKGVHVGSSLSPLSPLLRTVHLPLGFFPRGEVLIKASDWHLHKKNVERLQDVVKIN